MDSVQYLLKVFFKLAVTTFFIIFIWWCFITFLPKVISFPLFSFEKDFSSPSFLKKDWLPSPKNNTGLFGKAKTPSKNDNVQTWSQPFSKYGSDNFKNDGSAVVDYVTYSEKGGTVIHGSEMYPLVEKKEMLAKPSGTDTLYSQKNLLIRNLSLREYQSIRTSFVFSGEARESMFRKGTLPVLLLDQQGKVISSSLGQATTNWTVPGWIKFQVVLQGTYPKNVPCFIAFEKTIYENGQMKPSYISFPVICN